MVFPKIHFNWNLDVGNVLMLFSFLLAGIGAYYDLKSDVRDLKSVQSAKFITYDQFMIDQRHQDERQDSARDAVAADLKDTLRDKTREIQTDIRDLRNDLMRGSTKR